MEVDKDFDFGAERLDLINYNMIKILQIRETPLTKCAGVDANCQALIDYFLAMIQ